VRLKVAVVTPIFPVPSQLYRGQSIHQIVRALMKRAEVEVICPFSRYPKWFQPSFDHRIPDLSYSLPDVSTRYFEYPAIPGLTRCINGIVCAKYLEPYLREFMADVVLNFWLYPEGYAAVRVADNLGIPAVVCSIGSDLNCIPDPASRYLTRITMERAAIVVTKSEPLRARAIQMGIHPRKVRTVLNGCDSGTFHRASRNTARAQLAVDERAELVLYVGRLDPAKGIMELFDAFALLANHRPNLRLTYIGDGPGGDQLRRRAKDAELETRISLANSCSSEEVAQWLAASNVLALASYAEGSPNVILEALSCGRPVIGTNVGGIPDMINEECGILIAPGDVPALADAIEESIRRNWDEQLIAKQFRRGWDHVADEYFTICEQAVQNRCGNMQPSDEAITVIVR
jgi:teichuronic acid biosynthesis glycosyltransferase TuaC